MRYVPRFLAAYLVALCLWGAPVWAEDRNFTLVWQHDGQNKDGSASTLSHFVLGWGFQSGPPYANIIPVPGGTTRSQFVPITNLSPGDILYFSVQACNTNNRCSAWSVEVAHSVIADSQIPSSSPSVPQAVMLVIQAPTS